MKRAVKNKIADTLHHGVVYACMGLTLITIVATAQLGYDYYVNIKPVKKAERIKAEQELLREGTAFVPDV